MRPWRLRVEPTPPAEHGALLLERRLLGMGVAVVWRVAASRREAELAVRNGEADALVARPPRADDADGELRTAAWLPRGDVEDALCGPAAGGGLEGLPAGARVAAATPLQRAQLLHVRPDLNVVATPPGWPALQAHLADAAAVAGIVARAELQGRERADAAFLPFDQALPGPLRGLVGVSCRADDPSTRERMAAFDDPAARVAAEAEMAFIEALGLQDAPVAAFALVGMDRLQLSARVLDADGGEALDAVLAGPTSAARRVGENLAVVLVEQGARELARRSPRGRAAGSASVVRKERPRFGEP